MYKMYKHDDENLACRLCGAEHSPPAHTNADMKLPSKQHVFREGRLMKDIPGYNRPGLITEYEPDHDYIDGWAPNTLMSLCGCMVGSPVDMSKSMNKTQIVEVAGTKLCKLCLKSM